MRHPWNLRIVRFRFAIHFDWLVHSGKVGVRMTRRWWKMMIAYWAFATVLMTTLYLTTVGSTTWVWPVVDGSLFVLFLWKYITIRKTLPRAIRFTWWTYIVARRRAKRDEALEWAQHSHAYCGPNRWMSRWEYTEALTRRMRREGRAKPGRLRLLDHPMP